MVVKGRGVENHPARMLARTHESRETNHPTKHPGNKKLKFCKCKSAEGKSVSWPTTKVMDQYSRQIGAYGLETMGRLISLDVLIVGMRGVGIECAKNLCLAGPRSVTVCDPNKVYMRDLGSNFFLSKEDVGKPRGECVTSKLNELNGMVTVKSIPVLTEDAVKNSSVLIFTDGSREELIKWNEFCRAHKVAFMAADVLGCFGYMFTDFIEHVVRDSNGENPNVRVITDITNDEKGVVTVLALQTRGSSLWH